jgi:FtsP/CotA-like multicopper oxidase with cupredoxin domain
MPIVTRRDRIACNAKRLIDRRGFVLGAGATGAALGAGLGTVLAQTRDAADFTLRIAHTKIELAPGKIIDTFAYNGLVPGPLLRVREGQPVTIDVTNETDVEDIVHWHGLYLPPAADGAMEEGSPMIARGGTQRYRFTAKPSGTRWYHSHNIAGADLTRSVYTGMYGFFVIDHRELSGPLRPRSHARCAPLGTKVGEYAGYPQRPTPG